MDIKKGKSNLMLRRALLELLQNNYFEAITVNDICFKAMISRTTFYFHYIDKFDLLLELIIELQINNYIPNKPSDMTIDDMVDIVVNTVLNNKKVFFNLFNSKDIIEIISLYYKNFEKMLHLLVNSSHFRIKEDIPLEVLSPVCIAGIINLINYWLISNDCTEKELTKYLHRFLTNNLIA